MTVPTECTPGATRFRSVLHVAPPSVECDRNSCDGPLGPVGLKKLVVLTDRSKNRLPALSIRSRPPWGICFATFQECPSSLLSDRNVLLLQLITTTRVPSGRGWTPAPALEDCPPHSGYG